MSKVLAEHSPPFPKNVSRETDDDDDDDDEGNYNETESIHSYTKYTDTESSDRGEGKGALVSIGNKETTQIRKIRFLLFLVIIFAIACSIGVFFYVRNTEMYAFETQYEEDAVKVLASLGSTLDFTLGGINALAVSLIAYSVESGEEWPFVSMPNFDVKAGKFLSLSKGFVINTYPVVRDDQRKAWENYTAHNNDWVQEGIDIQRGNSHYKGPNVVEYEMWDVIHDYDEWDKPNPGEFGTNRTGPYMPWWQCVPVIPIDPPYNWDLMSWVDEEVMAPIETHKVSISAAYMIAYEDDLEQIADNEAEAEWVKDYIGPDEEPMEPISSLRYPLILESTSVFNLWDNPEGYNPEDYTFVGIMDLAFYWRSMIQNLLPHGSDGVVLVFENECSPPFTYKILGPTVEYMGTGDFHETRFDEYMIEKPLINLGEFASKDSDYSGPPVNDDVCPFIIKSYPSTTMENNFLTSNPALLSISAGLIFLIFAAIFVVYDNWVQRRQNLIMRRAEKTTEIVQNIFPEAIARKLVAEAENADSGGKKNFMSPKARVKTFLNNGDDGVAETDKPIADLFPHTTVFFADISGFTAWSSSRDPSQVFVLLETIYKAFDTIAKRRKVFKIETVGDCYVAVTGLPDPQANHAVLMSRFAWECLGKFASLVKTLEVSLGPDTADLALRVGINSGPVTAGVLRGERSRFQLFGDTVNTAARMESTGAPNRIQISSSTASLLKQAGKKQWLTYREDSIVAKGKGLIDSYWLHVKNTRASRSISGASVSSHVTGASTSDIENPELAIVGHKDFAINVGTKRARLEDWVVSLLLEHIRNVVAHHNAIGIARDHPSQVTFTAIPGQNCLDEVKDVVKLPKYDTKAELTADPSKVQVSSSVVIQLRKLVNILASTYRENPFHNYEHACHVMMSVDKFLKRIVNPDVDTGTSSDNILVALHDFTHGINSDPVTIMAIVFSALIHDSDHRGISNGQLCKEDEAMANAYRNQSVAEQNSVDVSWEILMRDDFAELRNFIFPNKDELARFRQVVINVVLATDIFDKELNDRRKSRWNRAFSGELTETDDAFVDTRATIVIEHIIQASDVSHTMQHWHIYRKWNERLFRELYAAFKEGRMGADPCQFWYKGEIGFFDNYIIPLAKKLKDCNVFGVSSDECLAYAMKNREQWEKNGEAAVEEMIAKIN